MRAPIRILGNVTSIFIIVRITLYQTLPIWITQYPQGQVYSLQLMDPTHSPRIPSPHQNTVFNLLFCPAAPLHPRPPFPFLHCVPLPFFFLPLQTSHPSSRSPPLRRSGPTPPPPPLPFCSHLPILFLQDPGPPLPAPCRRVPGARCAPPAAASRAALAGAGTGAGAEAAPPPAEPHPPGGRAVAAAAAGRGSDSASYLRLGPAGVSATTVPASHSPGPQRCRANHRPRPPWPDGRPKPLTPTRCASALSVGTQPP